MAAPGSVTSGSQRPRDDHDRCAIRPPGELDDVAGEASDPGLFLPRQVDGAGEGQVGGEPGSIVEADPVSGSDCPKDGLALPGDEVHDEAHARRPLPQPRNPAARSICGSSVGEPATWKPAASSAATFDAAVPEPPEMIAPAWPIRRPSGAVRPAMNAAFGTSRRCSPAQIAASSSAAPPISPMRTMARVSGSAANSWRTSRNVVPMIGSPPIPTHVDWPTPASDIAWTASYVSVPDRDTTPTEPSR